MSYNSRIKNLPGGVTQISASLLSVPKAEFTDTAAKTVFNQLSGNIAEFTNLTASEILVSEIYIKSPTYVAGEQLIAGNPVSFDYISGNLKKSYPFAYLLDDNVISTVDNLGQILCSANATNNEILITYGTSDNVNQYFLIASINDSGALNKGQIYNFGTESNCPHPIRPQDLIYDPLSEKYCSFARIGGGGGNPTTLAFNYFSNSGSNLVRTQVATVSPYYIFDHLAVYDDLNQAILLLTKTSNTNINARAYKWNIGSGSYSLLQNTNYTVSGSYAFNTVGYAVLKHPTMSKFKIDIVPGFNSGTLEYEWSGAAFSFNFFSGSNQLRNAYVIDGIKNYYVKNIQYGIEIFDYSGISKGTILYTDLLKKLGINEFIDSFGNVINSAYDSGIFKYINGNLVFIITIGKTGTGYYGRSFVVVIKADFENSKYQLIDSTEINSYTVGNTYSLEFLQNKNVLLSAYNTYEGREGFNETANIGVITSSLKHTSLDFAGIVQNDTSIGQPVKLSKFGDISNIHSSLNVGKNYYIGSNNTLVTTENNKSINSNIIGKAISSNEILVSKNQNMLNVDDIGKTVQFRHLVLDYIGENASIVEDSGSNSKSNLLFESDLYLSSDKILGLGASGITSRLFYNTTNTFGITVTSSLTLPAASGHGIIRYWWISGSIVLGTRTYDFSKNAGIGNGHYNLISSGDYSGSIPTSYTSDLNTSTGIFNFYRSGSSGNYLYAWYEWTPATYNW